MRALFALGFASLFALASSGCSFRGCNDDYVYPSYRITVANGATGEAICDANVTVNGVTARRSEIDCSFVLEIPENVTLATVAASKVGFQPTSEDVSTDYDEDERGHAIERRVKLVLTPQ